MIESHTLNLLLGSIGGYLHVETGLAVERYGIVDGRFHKVFFVPYRPLGIAYGGIVAQSLCAKVPR